MLMKDGQNFYGVYADLAATSQLRQRVTSRRSMSRLNVLIFHIDRLCLEEVVHGVHMHLLTDAELLPTPNRHVKPLCGCSAVECYSTRFEELGEPEGALNVTSIDGACRSIDEMENERLVVGTTYCKGRIQYC